MTKKVITKKVLKKKVLKKKIVKPKVKKTTLDDVITIIDKWQKDKVVIFHGCFISFDKDDNIVENRCIAYGVKKIIKKELKEMTKIVNDDKNKFINW